LTCWLDLRIYFIYFLSSLTETELKTDLPAWSYWWIPISKDKKMLVNALSQPKKCIRKSASGGNVGFKRNEALNLLRWAMATWPCWSGIVPLAREKPPFFNKLSINPFLCNIICDQLPLSCPCSLFPNCSCRPKHSHTTANWKNRLRIF